MSPSIVWTDKATTEDLLDFDDYRRTIVRVILQADTPITMGVFGRWGAGKTSLMQMICHDLEKAGAQTVWFDAWKYDKEDALWRALLLQALLTLRQRLPEGDDAISKLDDLQAALYRTVDRDVLGGVEIDWGKLIADTAQGAVRISLSFIPGFQVLGEAAKNLLGETRGQAESILSAIQRERIKVHQDQIRFLEQFQDRFAELVRYFLEKNECRHVVVFVDDLDRCLPEKAVEVLEAIKLFLDVPGCVFILAMDRAVIQKGIELKYSEKGVRLPICGDDYLEKIIQVPFNLPPLASGVVERFISNALNDFPRHLVQVFAAGLEPNPRQIKRTLNIFRLLCTLASEREELGQVVDQELLAKMVVIQVRYRETLYADVVEYTNLLGDLEEYFTLDDQAVRAGAILPTKLDGTLVGRYALDKPLRQMLTTGTARFGSTPDMAPYIYLTRTTAAEQSEQQRVVGLDDQTWSDLLSGDRTRVRAAVERSDTHERTHYVADLLCIIKDDRAYSFRVRASAGEALSHIGDPRFKVTEKSGKRFVEPHLVEVPAGEFWMGTDQQRVDELMMRHNQDWWKRELPQHLVKLGQFQIGMYPLTEMEYWLFVQSTKRKPPPHWREGMFPPGRASHPVINVSWHDALAYCSWLAEITGRHCRLPTEAEWEKAARGAQDKREWPWGDEFEPEFCNTAEGETIESTTVVGISPSGASPYGAMDMIGNVWEWTSTVLRKYPYTVDDGRENLEVHSPRVLRGGGWYDSRAYARCASRSDYQPDNAHNNRGFRVVVE